MKKTLFGTVAVGALMMAASSVYADSRVFLSAVRSADLGSGAKVAVRYYTPGNALINANGEGACTGAQGTLVVDGGRADGRYCEVGFRTNGTGTYKGYNEDIANYDGASGPTYLAVWDMQTGAGTGDHIGYYFLASLPVTINDGGSNWQNTDCGGTIAQTCLGQGNGSNSTGTATGPVPAGGATGGNVGPQGGFRPIPAPTVSSYTAATGDIVLNWNAASSFNTAQPIQYELFSTRSAPTGNQCAQVSETAFSGAPLQTLTGTTTTVNRSAVPGSGDCITFAIRLKYPNAGGTPVSGRYVSANSQGVYVGAGGLSANVFNIVAKWTNATNIAVSFQTSLEDGVRGFYVTRSFTANGQYSRVSQLIPAKGEPSSYTFIDTVSAPAGMTKAAGVFYKIESLDIDDAVQAYGPAKAQLPIDKNLIIDNRGKGAKKSPRK